MKRAFEAILILVAVEAAHFIILAGILCGLGFFTRGNGEAAVTFRELLWDGALSFWFDGIGAVLLLCLVGVLGCCAWDVYTDWLALEKRRKALEQEAERRADKKVEELRPQLLASMEAAFEREYSMRENSLLEGNHRLRAAQAKLDAGRHELAKSREELLEDEEKVTVWREELRALQRKSTVVKEKHIALKQRIRWAREALGEAPPNTGLALRHLKNAEKL